MFLKGLPDQHAYRNFAIATHSGKSVREYPEKDEQMACSLKDYAYNFLCKIYMVKVL